MLTIRFMYSGKIYNKWQLCFAGPTEYLHDAMGYYHAALREAMDRKVISDRMTDDIEELYSNNFAISTAYDISLPRSLCNFHTNSIDSIIPTSFSPCNSYANYIAI